ncbi:MAG: hypothetical protein AB7I50_24325 [Vicinamibacterales bacterium]
MRSAHVLWSLVSVVLLLAGVGGLVWWRTFREAPEPTVEAPASDPFGHILHGIVLAQRPQ